MHNSLLRFTEPRKAQFIIRCLKYFIEREFNIGFSPPRSSKVTIIATVKIYMRR